MYLVDTHILIWWLIDPDRLSASQTEALDSIDSQSPPLGISPVSFVEIARLRIRGYLKVPQPVGPWLERIERDARIRVYPLTARIATESVMLPEAFPRDPSDRVIAATARIHGLTLITSDKAIRSSGVVKVI